MDSQETLYHFIDSRIVERLRDSVWWDQTGITQEHTSFGMAVCRFDKSFQDFEDCV